jgi:hypothetical protein
MDRQVLDCASLLALSMGWARQKRQRTAALQDAGARKPVRLGSHAPSPGREGQNRDFQPKAGLCNQALMRELHFSNGRASA